MDLSEMPDSASGSSEVRDCSLPMDRIMAPAFWMSGAIAVAVALVFWLVWGGDRLKAGFRHDFLTMVLVFVLGTLAHELIHGFSWAVLSRMPFNAIQFGFQWKTLTPYAHPREPLSATPYRWGTVMPLLVLGILPAAVSLVTGNGSQLAFGVLFTLLAGGDLVVLWLLRGVSANSLVEDHPVNAGCLVRER